jgi:1-aminocyclopropane-1-carboxylate deaminase
MLFTEKLRPRLDTLQFDLLNQKEITADVLRLDLIDPVISGNKWFKLKEYLVEATDKNKRTIITFGGAFSNHILATACLCKETGFQSVGIIRGGQPKTLSHTLQWAKHCGMDLFYVEREEYKTKKLPNTVHDKYPDAYLINEGGYGLPGVKGVSTILNLSNTKEYTHILTAVGTGTTLAGLIEGSEKSQQIIGISSLKNNFELDAQINDLLSGGNKNRFQLLHQFHFGGYAKHNDTLIAFMNEWYRTTNIPSDFVYTAKLFFAFNALLMENYFPPQSKILLLHTGGLQGNNSLKKGTLIF